MTSFAAALSEPATWALELYFVPAAWLAKPTPTSMTSQTPITSARWRAEKTATLRSRDDTVGPPLGSGLVPAGQARGRWAGLLVVEEELRHGRQHAGAAPPDHRGPPLNPLPE